jgi:hypothetical protein
MKALVCMVAWLLVPIAFLSVCYDVAKAFVEDKLGAVLEKKE